MTKHTPATPDHAELEAIAEITRRANAYPKLVEALREMVRRYDARNLSHLESADAGAMREIVNEARALLRSLGED